MKTVTTQESRDTPAVPETLTRWRSLRRRLTPEDPLFEEGTVLCNMYYSKWTFYGEDEAEFDLARVGKEFACHERGCKKSFDNLNSYERHYYNEHRYVCLTCRRPFPNGHLLDLHVSEWHDAVFEVKAERQPMYQCLLEACPQIFSNVKARKDHMVTVHKYPASFRFDRQKKMTCANTKIAPTSKTDTTVAAKSRSAMDSSDVTAVSKGSDLVPAHSSCIGADDAREKMPLLTDDVTMATSDDVTGAAEGVDQSKESTGSRFTYAYKVPKNICFGQGSQRGFRRQRGKPRHWHQSARSDEDTSVQIENVNMSELLDAMDS